MRIAPDEALRADAGAIEVFGLPSEQAQARQRLSYLAERFNPPGFATGLELLRYLHAHAPKVEAKVVGVETADHPTDKQVLAHARARFQAIDRMRSHA